MYSQDILKHAEAMGMDRPLIDLDEIPEMISVDVAHNIMEATGVSWQQWNYFLDDCHVEPEYCCVYGRGIWEVSSTDLLDWLGVLEDLRFD